MSKLRLTVLVENTAGGHGLLAEHGLAFWIEAGSRRIVFDTGQSAILCRNAARLGIDLGSADAVVLSHGHYDHSGGLADLLNQTGPKKVFVHPAALEGKYGCRQNDTSRYIGMPKQSATAVQQTADAVNTSAPTEICEGVAVTGPIPRVSDFEDTGGPFFKDAGCNEPDELIDDQALFVDTTAGVVVILGCAHAGIVNTLQYIKTLLPARPIHAVIGGMHLSNVDERRLGRTVEALREFDIRRLYPLHCTGFMATVRLRNEFEDRVSLCPVGTKIDFAEKEKRQT